MRTSASASSASSETSNNDGMGEETGRNAVTVGTQTDERDWRLQEQPWAGKNVAVDMQTIMSCFRLQDQDGHLLPGIPNEITLDEIVPKLMWRDFHALSSVSHPWQQAIQSHQVHDARVRSQSTDTLVVIRSRKKYFLTLYSVRDDCYHRLPGIPHLETGGVPWVFECISLNGKLYVFGGLQSNADDRFKEVYVLDFAGQRKWKQCASMEISRTRFGCGAIRGKIYVFGGVYAQKLVRVAEVYDPKDNRWSRISPSPIRRFGYNVATLGEELFLYGGYYCLSDDSKMCGRADLFWDVYHPAKDEWRIVQPFKEKPLAMEFIARGKFHLLTEVGIDVYDHEKNTWSHLHSLNLHSVFPRFDGLEDDIEIAYSVLAVNDEILVTASSKDIDESETAFVRRSKGFGIDKENLLWEEEKRSIPRAELDMECTIQL